MRGNLGRTSAHRRAMINNMITSLFAHERIRTTVAKAKAARRVAERMITYAKRDTLHARRLAHRRIRDNEVLKKLFAVLGPRYQDRPGGYTRVIRLAPRLGDGTELAILELVGRFGAGVAAGEEKPKRRRKKAEQAEADTDVGEADQDAGEAGEDAGEAAKDAGKAGEDAGKAGEDAAEAAEEAAAEESVDESEAPEADDAEADGSTKAKAKAKPKAKRRGFLRRRKRSE
jgi:large subunit ribosomal protein L17